MAEAEEDFGLDAYLDIQAELGQWGEESSSTPATPRYSPGPATPASARGRVRDAADDGDDDAMVVGDNTIFSPSSVRSPNAARYDPAGVQTPAGGHVIPEEEEEQYDEMDDDFMATTEQLIGDGTDTYRPYHDALFAYLRSKERMSEVFADANDNDVSMMQIDGDNDEKAEAQAASDDAEMRFLESLASICLTRGRKSNNVTSGQEAKDDNDNDFFMSEASKNEGNFWDLLCALRSIGPNSLFHCVNDGEEPVELTLANDPTTMLESAPADALDACLGGMERNASAPLQRLNAALGWIEACHGRKFEEALEREASGGNSGDPILPPPGRRTMWPGTIAKLRRQPTNQSAGTFHPDAGHSHASPSSFLTPQDETDDARLLRACFMLFQSGRMEDALALVDDCGQPHFCANWTGGAPLSSDGKSGNPNRGLWKNQCRKISGMMARQVDRDVSSMANNGGAGERGLFPSLAYEAAITSLLSDRADDALRNPVFRTWEDGVHAILSSEMGIIEDDVLKSHNTARVQACTAKGGRFPYLGMETDTLDDGTCPRGNDGDLGAALEKLESSPDERIREEGADPFRNGMTSFLAGRDAPKGYMEECGALSLEAQDDDAACFLRFVAHLVLYVDSVLPEFTARLALPAGIDGGTDTDGGISLKELLVLKYVAYLSSRRDLWPHVALYTSLLSNENVLDTFSSFLIRVHSDRERRMMLEQARDLFAKGLDLYILRNVVRGMIMCDLENDFVREPGEEAAPTGVAPAEARMMRSINWLCYYPEHRPDALVGANMLLRRFLLFSEDDETGRDLYAPKVFIERILPKDLIDVAVEQCQKEDQEVAGFISYPMVQNFEAEHLSIESFLKAHTKYVQFLDGIAKTSPCHSSNKLVDASRSKHETEIADKMERNAFRKKKMGLCKMIIELASRASDALTEVLTFAGGWLVDVNSNLEEEEIETEEAKARSEELEAIRLKFVPRVVFMLQEVLDKTGMWLEQIVHDTLAQFGSASEDMLLTLFGSFDETYRSNEDSVMDFLATSPAAPGYWHKRAVSLSGIVANDGHGLHETFTHEAMESFLSLMAKSYVKLYRCSNGQTLFDY